jgi:perosamine synthetase
MDHHMDIISSKLIYKPMLALESISEILSGGAALHGRSTVVRTYEEALAHLLDVSGVVAVNSGTTAIELALLALGIGAEDDVLVPSYAPIMTALPLLRTGSRPIFYDCQADQLYPSLSDIRKARTPRTSVIITVSAWGYPFDYPSFRSFCDDMGLPWIEDAAQAHGSIFQRRPSAYWADVSCYSTHERKLLTTGEGGFVASQNTQLLQRVRTMVNYGGVEIDGNWEMGHAWGGNLKLPAISAALGISQLGLLPERLAARRELFTTMLERFTAGHAATPHRILEGGRPNGYAFLAVASPDTAPRELCYRLERAKVETDILNYDYKPVYQYPVFAGHRRCCPNIDALHTRLITLPSHEEIGPAELTRMMNCLQRRA